MSDNWNALTDEERTKALAEKVPGFVRYEHWDWCEVPKGWIILSDGRVLMFSPLTDLNHTALLWAALNKEQKVRVENRLMQTFTEGNQWVICDIMLDPLQLSRAIFAVTVGQEEITDE